MLLTKHENETFLNQTVYISGQAFVRCNFIACTLVLRETVYHLEGCTFERCNWHVDWVLMWGSPESIREIKALVSLIETAQQQQLPADQLNPRPARRRSHPMGRRLSNSNPVSSSNPADKLISNLHEPRSKDRGSWFCIMQHGRLTHGSVRQTTLKTPV